MSEVPTTPRSPEDAARRESASNEFLSGGTDVPTGGQAAIEGLEAIRRRIEQLSGEIGAERMLRADLLAVWEQQRQSRIQAALLKAAAFSASKERRLLLRARRSETLDRPVRSNGGQLPELSTSLSREHDRGRLREQFALVLLEYGRAIIEAATIMLLRAARVSRSDRQLTRRAIRR